MSQENLKKSEFWSDAWVRHIETYLAAPPRCEIWLNSQFKTKGKNVLECAGGSCRDARYLRQHGVLSIGSDFEERTIKYLEKRFPNSDLPIKKENAFHFSFESKSFDIVFHNGLWIYFKKNEIIELIIEQARITRKFLVALVHNAENNRLVETFREKAEADRLYGISFFQRDELIQIVKESGIAYKNLRIAKFGGSADRLFVLEKKFPKFRNFVHWLTPRLYRFQPWSKVERIALIVELD